MARLEYLVDTSVFARLAKPGVAAAFAPLSSARRVGLCAPVAFELGFSARNHDGYVAVRERLNSFPEIVVSGADHRRGLEVQEVLSSSGHHRALSLVDALVAAVAEAHGLTVLHYDADFELVSGVTGQKHRWIVPRGTAD